MVGGFLRSVFYQPLPKLEAALLHSDFNYSYYMQNTYHLHTQTTILKLDILTPPIMSISDCEIVDTFQTFWIGFLPM